MFFSSIDDFYVNWKITLAIALHNLHLDFVKVFCLFHLLILLDKSHRSKSLPAVALKNCWLGLKCHRA